MGTIKALYLPAELEKDVEVVELEQGDHKEYQRFVGGMFDVVAPAPGDVSFFIHDEGKILGLEPNIRATLWLYELAPSWIFYELFAGDVLVTGGVDDEGQTLGIPEETLESVTGHHVYMAQVFIKPNYWTTPDRLYKSYWAALAAGFDQVRNRDDATAFRACAM